MTEAPESQQPPVERNAPSTEADAETQLIEGLDAFSDAAVHLVKQAQRTLRLRSYDLDRRIYARPAMIDAVRSYLLQHDRARLQILVHSPQRTARQGGHRLVELARQLSSRIEIRNVPESARQSRPDALLVDSHQQLLRRNPDDREAQLLLDPRLTRRDEGDFDELWQLASPSQELRRLGI